MNFSEERRKRFLIPYLDQPLPLFIESIGCNPDQETVNRADGYPCFHWLQTKQGEGEFLFVGQKHILPPNTGILMFPRVAHDYRALTADWSTFYLTFGGSQAAGILAALGLKRSALFSWETGSPFADMIPSILRTIGSAGDLSGLEASSDLYRFLAMLKKYGQINKKPSVSANIDRLQPLIRWLENNYSDPGIGLPDMAERLQISPRYLNQLFHNTFGLTAYHYLIFLRMGKAKEMLISDQKIQVKEISYRVGYRDVSHFVATFRKLEGITPEQFRQLH